MTSIPIINQALFHDLFLVAPAPAKAPVQPAVPAAVAVSKEIPLPQSDQVLSQTSQGQAQASLAFLPERVTPKNLEQVRQGCVLEPGDQGQAVSDMQKLLSEAGFGVKATGVFGPSTETQLKAFQSAYDIQQTGKLGPTTLKALENPLKESALGRKIAGFGRQQALRLGGYSSLGKCYTGVANALSRAGIEVSGLSAYLAADQLARHDSFREVKVSRSQLSKLPAGAVVVWDRSPNAALRRQGGGYAHGHISIANGKGQEMSDFIGPQSTNYYASKHFRVFLPK